ncbi:MAG: non-canonical purine NTP pyrophosphatase, RdgB/HAM1 family [Gammaproteobacteria bacterium RIFCSPHIGHO2_12_FULL_41_15]|nr:MAG: non-canonical purine NTP pyrophosphatase, RdgB/HAM1 family [Gammaproteobacteria bacterium RIFCSPHIGHO2_12_FULL_41_15]
MRVVIASSNRGKLREITQLLSPYKLEIIPQSAFNLTAIEETGGTFIENAILKARHAAKHSGLPAFADDSGLVVPALNGAPGIFSARYAGKEATDQDRIHKLLAELSDVKADNRSAYFVCALAMLQHENDPAPIIAQGFWHGEILTEPRGRNGFGYDPIVYLPDLMRTAAELPDELKNTLSHRARAMQLFIKQLPNITSEIAS